MADEQRVYQGGVTIAAELVDEGQQVMQAGVTVASELVDSGQRVFQVGVTVAALKIAGNVIFMRHYRNLRT